MTVAVGVGCYSKTSDGASVWLLGTWASVPL